nr:immunoglobulin light chain junction region [Macaca mulatta]MPO01237.1 immunoglobulin light chain junction region [Macaca mulatta]
CQQCNSLPYRF